MFYILNKKEIDKLFKLNKKKIKKNIIIGNLTPCLLVIKYIFLLLFIMLLDGKSLQHKLKNLLELILLTNLLHQD